ncbi:MAG TPA: MazG nucleotide pyrophosphohydrolase domain-containing protein [Candidatus Binatia bacterium]|jgi:MazG family protein
MADKMNDAFPKSMPSLARAQRVTAWASEFGFDWPAVEPVWKKVEEELAELKAAVLSKDTDRVGEEMGDLFLSLVNLSRFLNVEAEDALSGAVDRFRRRFGYVEKKIQEQGRSLSQASLEEMDAFWEEAKQIERS